MVHIEGQDFTGFFGAGFDADKLRALSHAGRVEWLRFRFHLVFVTPFKELLAQDGGGCYVWLCAMNLLCGAVEALASFEVAGDPMKRFGDFVERYFRSDWTQRLDLHDLKPYRVATRPSDHLYKYFRSGLEHSLAIEWGGLRHREEVGPTHRLADGSFSYLFERQAVANQKSLGIIPREFVDDFYTAMERFFQAAASWGAGVPQREAFNERFEHVFLTCGTPSP
ncbi:MAG: hypothetical protein LAP21_19555 [Acidobacteriia bacterium]|nr:hypothetical protein [Terriglobia bacterium]